MADKIRAAVALGAGGARGYAHIGALEVLEERQIEIVALAGTSMGSCIAGVAAAGKLAEYTEWARTLTQREVVRLMAPTTAPGGFFSADRVIAKMGEIVEDATIESLPIPYTAVATDLVAQREVWFQSGPLTHAIRASCAIPGVITPVVINGRTLVDGGLLNPVPIAPTTSVHSDITIAVDLSGPRSPASASTPLKESADDEPHEEWTSRLRRSTSEMLESERVRTLVARLGVHWPEPTAAVPPEEPIIGRADIGTMNLLNMSFEVMSGLVSRFRMASNPPDVLVTVPSNAVGTLDFHKAGEMIDLGRRLTTEALDHAGY